MKERTGRKWESKIKQKVMVRGRSDGSMNRLEEGMRGGDRKNSRLRSLDNKSSDG